MNSIIGFWGCPPKEVINKFKNDFKEIEWVDLDIDYGHPDTKIAPDNYCVIIKNIINNAMYFKDSLITVIAPIGKDKCDSAYFVSQFLKNLGFNIVETVFEDKCPDIKTARTPISKSNLPLRQKIELITKNIIEQKDYSDLPSVRPDFGFWGVPPNDLSILELFPDNTHVFGWSRAVEAGFPADWSLETYVDVSIPTVFFTQAFCSKTLIAKSLANKYQGLFIDIDSISNNSARAKIEAFIKLR